MLFGHISKNDIHEVKKKERTPEFLHNVLVFQTSSSYSIYNATATLFNSPAFILHDDKRDVMNLELVHSELEMKDYTDLNLLNLLYVSYTHFLVPPHQTQSNYTYCDAFSVLSCTCGNKRLLQADGSCCRGIVTSE